MKKVQTVLQWIGVVMFAIMAISTLASGNIIGTLLFLLGGAVIAPLQPVRKIRSKLKLKKTVTVVLAIVFLIAGSITLPSLPETDITDAPDVSDTTNETVSQDEINEDVSDKTYTTPETSSQEQTPPKTEDKVVGNGTAQAVQISSLPSYSGTAYSVINNNIPNFSSSELTSKGYENYSSLDSLGRCGVALASVGKDTMPPDGATRGSISSIKPTGWVQAQYSGISGGYLWNRCHLIGWQLSEENANKQNLITGTRYMNTEGMLPFENMVADYIKETNNHVAYRVTPIFEGDNLVCSGVQMEAYSIEDDGEGICFNVYCYNVQPDITINYATGESSGKEVAPSNQETSSQQNQSNDSQSQTEQTQPSNQETDDSSETQGQTVWIPTNGGKKYHSKSTCSNMKNPAQVTRDEAISRGFDACKKCY